MRDFIKWFTYYKKCSCFREKLFVWKCVVRFEICSKNIKYVRDFQRGRPKKWIPIDMVRGFDLDRECIVQGAIYRDFKLRVYSVRPIQIRGWNWTFSYNITNPTCAVTSYNKQSENFEDHVWLYQQQILSDHIVSSFCSSITATHWGDIATNEARKNTNQRTLKTHIWLHTDLHFARNTIMFKNSYLAATASAAAFHLCTMFNIPSS